MSIAALLLFIRALGLTLPLWIVAGWSAAESAIFFIVADVPISWIAVRSGTKAAMLAAVVAALASIAGAAIVFLWAGRDPVGAAATMAHLPAIDPALVARAAEDYHRGPLAMLAGSFSGTPFKLYALEAAKVRRLFAAFARAADPSSPLPACGPVRRRRFPLAPPLARMSAGASRCSAYRGCSSTPSISAAMPG